ncbi:MAG: hypothetical protein M0T70_13470 [Geobacteraceae bacterium]|nr:hypothetical protein [Geobacteraceae bacterium]
MKLGRILAAAGLAVTLACGTALATPSTQIWIPSTDIQPYKVFHLNIDGYFRASGVPKSPPTAAATRDANVYDIGPTVGILPFEKLQAEIGFDYYSNANEPNDNHPVSGNFKIGTPEDSLFKYSPALAAGMYNIGPSLSQSVSPLVCSGQNIAYVLAAKTLPAIGSVPSLGRISAGYYRGSERALVNIDGKKDNDGLLLSWDRSMTEISDKLWMAVDYQSGHNADSALNIGASWNFAKNVSVIFGYDIYNDKRVAGNNTFTTQLDINFP